MSRMILMQGPSGSGKSSVAKRLSVVHNAVICSTDDYFFADDGNYVFDPTKLGENHTMNLERACYFMAAGVDVIIDNTNLANWEIRPYVEAANKFGYEIEIVRCNGNFQNIHGVPQDRVELMRTRMEDLSVEAALVAVRPF